MKKIVTVVATLFLVNIAAAQITLDQSNVQALIDMRTTTVDYAATDTNGTWALFNQAGTNQTWDITSFGWVAEDTTATDRFSSIAGTLGENDPDFANANFVQVVADDSVGAAAYAMFDAAGIWDIGAMLVDDENGDMIPDTAKVLYSPASLDIPFPFTFGTAVSDSTTLTISYADTLAFSTEVAKDGEVDGWGTLVTPDGSFDVLRYRYQERTHVLGFMRIDEVVEWWGPAGPIFQISVEEQILGPPAVEVTYESSTVTEITSIDATPEIPDNFSLKQNYPNPFNPSTVIPFELQEASSVKLVVYDMLGRQIDTLVDGVLPIGQHQVPWAPEALTGGMYIAQLEVNGRKQARTMTLLK